MWYVYFVRLETSISSENHLIGINLGGKEFQVDPKKMDLFLQSVVILCYGAALYMMAKFCDIYFQL